VTLQTLQFTVHMRDSCHI